MLNEDIKLKTLFYKSEVTVHHIIQDFDVAKKNCCMWFFIHGHSHRDKKNSVKFK